MSTVTINFQYEWLAKAFMSWMDGQGEQDFPLWYEEEQNDHPEVCPVSDYYDKFEYDYNTNTINMTIEKR